MADRRQPAPVVWFVVTVGWLTVGGFAVPLIQLWRYAARTESGTPLIMYLFVGVASAVLLLVAGLAAIGAIGLMRGRMYGAVALGVLTGLIGLVCAYLFASGVAGRLTSAPDTPPVAMLILAVGVALAIGFQLALGSHGVREWLGRPPRTSGGGRLRAVIAGGVSLLLISGLVVVNVIRTDTPHGCPYASAGSAAGAALLAAGKESARGWQPNPELDIPDGHFPSNFKPWHVNPYAPRPMGDRWAKGIYDPWGYITGHERQAAELLVMLYDAMVLPAWQLKDHPELAKYIPEHRKFVDFIVFLHPDALPLWVEAKSVGVVDPVTEPEKRIAETFSEAIEHYMLHPYVATSGHKNWTRGMIFIYGPRHYQAADGTTKAIDLSEVIKHINKKINAWKRDTRTDAWEEKQESETAEPSLEQLRDDLAEQRSLAAEMDAHLDYIDQALQAIAAEIEAAKHLPEAASSETIAALTNEAKELQEARKTVERAANRAGQKTQALQNQITNQQNGTTQTKPPPKQSPTGTGKEQTFQQDINNVAIAVGDEQGTDVVDITPENTTPTQVTNSSCGIRLGPP